jgi:hypothetical protein
MADKKVLSSTLVGVGRRELYRIFADRGFTKGCEVGVFRGRNAIRMFEEIPNLELILVDPYMVYEYRNFKKRNRWKWKIEVMDKIRREAVKRLAKENIRWLMTTSELAATSIPDGSLDFVYIDGNHSFEFVAQDVILWGRKVRSGGMISGHDYGIRSVRKAVDWYARSKGYIVATTDQNMEKKKSRIVISWIMEKP